MAVAPPPSMLRQEGRGQRSCTAKIEGEETAAEARAHPDLWEKSRSSGLLELMAEVTHS